MNDKKKFRDILDAIEAIEAYSVSSYDEFLADANKSNCKLCGKFFNGTWKA